MRNIKFGSIFLCLLLFQWNVIFLSCSSGLILQSEEIITLELPSWPPEDSLSNKYPELSRWKIELCSPSSNKIFYTQEKSFSITTEKNIPLFLTATPITKNGDAKENQLFLPAGFIYPFFQTITWEQGFIAESGKKIIKSKMETGVSAGRLEKFLKSFNWKKAQETVEKRIYGAEVVSNPWFINSVEFITDLCYGDFKTSTLNINGCYIFEKENLLPSSEFISPFVPENQSIFDTGKLKLQKEYKNFMILNKNSGVLLSVQSSKNVLIQYIYLPIFIEDI